MTDPDTAAFNLQMDSLKKEIEALRRINAAVSREREHLKAILWTTPDLVVFKDVNFIYRAVNKSFCDFLGKSEHDIIGRTDFDIFPREEAERYRSDDQKVLKGIAQIQDEAVTGREGRRYLQVAKNAMYDSAGRLLGILCSVRDVTERKLNERKKSEIMEFNQKILTTSPFGIFVYDSDGDCVFVNQAGAEIIGTTIDQALLANFRDLPSWKDSGLVSVAEEAIAAKVPITREVHHLSTFHKDLWLNCTFTTFTRNDRQHLLLMVKDVTEGKRAESDLKAQNAFMNSVIESVSFPFYVVDAKTHMIEMANSATGRDRAWEGKTCHEFTHRNEHPCDQKEHSCPLAEMKKTKQPVVLEHVHFDADGSRKNVEVHGYPIFDGQGNLAKMIEFAIDITGKKKTEAENTKLIEDLKNALSKVKLLSGFLPICASCKNIRDDKGYWSRIEAYITAHSEAEFSHGLCPDCAKKLYPGPYKHIYESDSE